jgi:hypothetical protein
MTVFDLIKILASLPAEARIYVNDDGNRIDPEPSLDEEKNEVDL